MYKQAADLLQMDFTFTSTLTSGLQSSPRVRNHHCFQSLLAQPFCFLPNQGTFLMLIQASENFFSASLERAVYLPVGVPVHAKPKKQKVSLGIMLLS